MELKHSVMDTQFYIDNSVNYISFMKDTMDTDFDIDITSCVILIIWFMELKHSVMDTQFYIDNSVNYISFMKDTMDTDFDIDITSCVILMKQHLPFMMCRLRSWILPRRYKQQNSSHKRL